MLYQLIRAVLASLLPLLPLLLRPGKVDDWTRMLTSGLTPQFLPHGYSNNISSETYELAHDFDESLTIDSFGHAISHCGSAHPLLEAFVAVARQLFPGLVAPSLRKLVPQFLAVCFPLMTWVVYLSVTSRTGSRRFKPCGAHPGDLDRCDLVPNGSDVDSARDCTSSSPTVDLGEHEASQRADTALDLSSKSRDDLCTSPVAELLLLWEEDAAVPAPVIELDDSQRPRSLSDITERSEPEDYDAKAGDTPRCHQYADSLGSIKDLVLQGPPTELTPKMLQVQEDLPMQRDLRCAFDTLSATNIAGDSKRPSPKPDLAAGPAHTYPQLPDTSSDPFISTPMELATPVQSTHSDSLRSTGEPPVSRSRRTSAILVARAGMRGQQVNLTSAGIEYAASQLQGKPDTMTAPSAKDERRRLERVATDAAAVFSEYKGAPRPLKDILWERAEAAEPSSDGIQRNILDGSQYPPLVQDAQTRRPIVELSRSRGGNGINPTSLVLLERNHASALRSNDISSAASVPPESFSLTEQSFPKLEPSQPRPTSLAVMIRPVKTDGTAPLSYAAMTAQPAPSPRPRYVSEQLRVAVANGLKRRAASAGVPPSQHATTPTRRSAVPAWRLSAHAPSFVPRTAARAPPLPTRGAEAAWNDQVAQERPLSASVRGNWRVRRLPSDRELNAEFVASPAPVPQMPLRQAGSAVRGSLLSVVERAAIRDLAQRAGARRADVRPAPTAETSTTPDACHASAQASVLLKSTPPSSPKPLKVGSVEDVRRRNTSVSPSPALALSHGPIEPRVDALAAIGVRSKWDRQRDLLELLADGLVVSDSDSRSGSGSSGLGSGALGDASVAAVVGSQTGSGSDSGGFVAFGSGLSGGGAGPGAMAIEADKKASLASPAHRIKLPDATNDANLVRRESQDAALARHLGLNTIAVADSLVPMTLSQLQPTASSMTTPELRVFVVVRLAGNAPEPSFASVGRTALRLLGSPAIPADPCRLAPSDALVERIHLKAGPPLLLPQERDWALVPRLRQSSAPASHAGSRDSLRQNIKLALARYRDQIHLPQAQTRSRRRIGSSPGAASAPATVPAEHYHYDPWALEDAQRAGGTASDAGMGRARHQGGPSRLSKARRGAAAVARLRTQTALLGLVGVGEESVRRRRTTTQITGGRYAVLECDVLLV